MAAQRVSSVELRNPWAFMNVLSSAACEWFLIVMLFVDAALSYLLTKFAHYCDLPTPCLLCSRIEHFLGESKHGFYWSLLCCNHKEEISSSVHCHIHNKLASVHAMCQDCLMSVARWSKSNSESCRILVAKLGIDIEESGLKTILLNKRFMADSNVPGNCSCCNRLLKAQSNAQRLLQVTPVGCGACKANVKPPLPHVPGHSRFSRRDGLKRLREKFSGPMVPHPGGKTVVDPLSHVGYTELKISSDTESEFPFSDDDDVASALNGSSGSRTDSNTQRDLQKLPKGPADSSTPTNQNHQTFEPLPSLLDQPVQLESSDVNIISQAGAFEKHGLQELNWGLPNQKRSASGLQELTPLDDVHQTSKHPKFSISAPQPSKLSILPELLALNSVISSSNVPIISEKDLVETDENGSVSVADGSSPAMSNISTMTFANANNDRRESGMVAELPRTNDSGMTADALNSPPRISSPDMDLSRNITSPRVSVQPDVLQKSDVSGSDAVDMIQMAAALERRDSGHESLDGISVNEIEGETFVDRLRRQIDYDKRCMKALFKELEEERGAAAIAANQAMAMITRLQEEKAALHMEALQYLRMMEEQAEYDMEALEKANDLLSEREKEMQDLEAELEVYRNNTIGEPFVDDPRIGTSNGTVESSISDNCSTAPVQSGCSTADDSKFNFNLRDGDKLEKLGSLELDIDSEKVYISQCLENLEKKFHQIPGNELRTKFPNGDGEELADDNQTRINNHHNEENGLSLQSISVNSVGANNLDDEESEHKDAVRDRYSTNGGESTLDRLKENATDLRDRLQALEIDNDILKHAVNMLSNGDDELQFIQEGGSW